MNGFDNPTYVLALVISNIVAIVILLSCWKNPRVGRILLFILFGWAGIFNWDMALSQPSGYINYADPAVLPFYKTFIRGWFSQHVLLIVGIIATGQLAIAVSMWLRGWLFKLGAIGGMLFLIGILPLGVGSGFPFPILAAFAFYLLYRTPHINYLWSGKPENPYTLQDL